MAHESHELLATCAPDRLIGHIDPKLRQRVLINLVGNAVKYSPAGGRVQLEATRDQDGLVFRVSDQGVGEPFHRGGNVGAIDGSGLGLAITQKAVEAHGGTITVQSAVGRGTTLVVSIPDPTV